MGNTTRIPDYYVDDGDMYPKLADVSQFNMAVVTHDTKGKSKPALLLRGHAQFYSGDQVAVRNVGNGWCQIAGIRIKDETSFRSPTPTYSMTPIYIHSRHLKVINEPV